MRHSIKRQMMVVFISLLTFMFAAILICNVWMLEPYYIRDKESKFISMYQALAAASEEGRLDMSDEEMYGELIRQAEKDNLFFLAVNMEKPMLVTNVQHSVELEQQLNAFLLNHTENNEKILEKTDSYEISQTKGKKSSAEYLMMRGDLGGGTFFLIQSPLESIQGSVALANRFLIAVGIVVIAVCMVLVWFFSRRLTEPLRELAELSEKMAELNFEAKYTSGGENEIGVLGENFNRMSEKLEKAVSDLKSANNQLVRDIEQKEKLEQMRTEFLGNVSHELKTPIALIQGYAEGLKEGIDDDPESREFYCDVIIDEVSKMNHMVKNLLTLNQLEFGSEEIQFERFDLTELVQGVLQSMELFAEQKQARVQFLQNESVYAWADEYKVEQVVRNYVSNAFNHVSGDRVVEVKIETRGDVARTTVFNTGTPIPDEDLAHIWEKFYKVDKAHTREYGGNGIGLSIVKAVMDSFHQKYGVENYDNGVAFWFELGIK
ncbi:MAG: HAMP domain-containing sensor histidine kinase [Eubacteriales bacterium]|nr:HAMP domain-containing sensor histidine kinase [Eubacteriales bacterium]